MYENIVIIGCSGALGKAFVSQLSNVYPDATIHGFSRQKQQPVGGNVAFYEMDFEQESGYQAAAELVGVDHPVDLILVTTGALHDETMMPEKTIRDTAMDQYHHMFQVNTLIPAMVMKHFIPKMSNTKQSLLAVMTARVGSISDNHLGGWYSYRASKAALNMLVRNTAIEVNRMHKNKIILGLHPGTVDSRLSKPFQEYVKEGHLFTPEFAVESLLQVMDRVTEESSGKLFAWDGEEIQP